jgi:16S rRNA (cytidine1402-2'-O)-methyltransferase
LIPFHDFNKERTTPRIIERLLGGENLALISDAGTPGVADEAFFLVREALRAGITVSPLPGPSSVIAALVCSGLPCDRFIFENFLPVKSGKRRTFFETLRTEKRTVIFFESPYRIMRALEDMRDVLGEPAVAVARELTKVHEEFLRGTPAALLQHFTAHPPRGEMVIMVNAAVNTENWKSCSQL